MVAWALQRPYGYLTHVGVEDNRRVLEKLRRLQHLAAQAATPSEQRAAEEARKRLVESLERSGVHVAPELVEEVGATTMPPDLPGLDAEFSGYEPTVLTPPAVPLVSNRAATPAVGNPASGRRTSKLVFLRSALFLCFGVTVTAVAVTLVLPQDRDLQSKPEPLNQKVRRLSERCLFSKPACSELGTLVASSEAASAWFTSDVPTRCLEESEEACMRVGKRYAQAREHGPDKAPEAFMALDCAVSGRCGSPN